MNDDVNEDIVQIGEMKSINVSSGFSALRFSFRLPAKNETTNLPSAPILSMMADESDSSPIFTIQLKREEWDSNLRPVEHDVAMHFEVHKSNPLQGVFERFSEVEGMPLKSLEFVFNGKSLVPEDTPSSLNMSNTNNIITVIGGYYPRINVNVKTYDMMKDITNDAIAETCMIGSTNAVIDILSQNDEYITQSVTWFDSDGLELSTPPLFIAIDYGHVELVANILLLTNTTTLNTLVGGEGKYTAIQWASWTGNLEICKLLVEEGGVKVDEESLSLAREFNHTNVIEYILQHIDLYADMYGDLDAIMERACYEGDFHMVKKLLEEENYDVGKWKDKDGKFLACTPLHMAVRKCHVDLIQLFAEKGMHIEEA